MAIYVKSYVDLVSKVFTTRIFHTSCSRPYHVTICFISFRKQSKMSHQEDARCETTWYYLTVLIVVWFYTLYTRISSSDGGSPVLCTDDIWFR